MISQTPKMKQIRESTMEEEEKGGIIRGKYITYHASLSYQTDKGHPITRRHLEERVQIHPGENRNSGHNVHPRMGSKQLFILKKLMSYRSNQQFSSATSHSSAVNHCRSSQTAPNPSAQAISSAHSPTDLIRPAHSSTHLANPKLT